MEDVYFQCVEKFVVDSVVYIQQLLELEVAAVVDGDTAAAVVVVVDGDVAVVDDGDAAAVVVDGDVVVLVVVHIESSNDYDLS